MCCALITKKGIIMNKLKELADICKYGVTVDVNDHTGNNESVEDWIADRHRVHCDKITKEKMVELDTTISVYFYPITETSFYEVLHYDIDLALSKAIRIAKNVVYPIKNIHQYC